MAKLNNKRRYPEEHGPRPDNAKFKREEAEARQTAYDKMSPQEKLDRLNEKFGKDVGAKKQRAKLLALIENKNKPVPVVEQEEVLVEETPKKIKAKDRRKKERKED